MVVYEQKARLPVRTGARMSGACPAQADLVLTGGKIWCGKGLAQTEAIAIFAERILATGSSDEIAPLIGSETQVIDLGGRLATPGLNDAHMHLLPYGTAMAELEMVMKY